MATAFRIPRGGTYPPLNGRVPQWWNTGVAGTGLDAFMDQYRFAETDKEIRFADPRWANSFKSTFGSGSSNEVDFRASCFNHPSGAATAAAGKYLYLAWHIKVHPATAYENSFIDVGFQPTSGTAVRYQIKLTAGTNSGTENSAPPPTNLGTFADGAFTVDYFLHTGGTSWALQAPASVPAWITSEGQVWTKPPTLTNNWWAVHMRVPVTPLAGGLDLSGTFGFGYYVEADASTFVIEYKWPSGLPDLNVASPNPTNYQRCFLDVGALSGGDTELRTGVSLSESNIGTQGVTATFTGAGGPYTITSPQAIKYTAGSTSTFFAHPINENTLSGVAANTIAARFVLANFGSMPPGGPWKTLGTGATHSAIAAAPPALGADILFNWTPNATDEAFYTANPHQCIMVDLSSPTDPNLTFLNSSAARNMDFGAASKFTRDALISVQGLSDGYSFAQRDVYIYVERVNVPAVMDDETRRKYKQVQETLRSVSSVAGDFDREQRYVSIVLGDLRHLQGIDFGDFLQWLETSARRDELTIRMALFELLRKFGVEASSLAELISRYGVRASEAYRQLRYDSAGQPQFTQPQRQIVDVLVANISYRGGVPPAAHPLPPEEELAQYMPAIRYHVYHDTGRISRRNGVNRPVVHSQPAFGYYIWLDHDVDKWELRLQGAEKLAENLYLIRPPTEGSVTVKTSIHAVQQGKQEEIEPPEKIVPFPTYPRQETKPGCFGFLHRLFGK